MPRQIHSTAIVSPKAEIDDDVIVGPYAVIEDPVTIGPETRIGAHAVIHSHVKIGRANVIHSHAVIGDLPQDLTFGDEETWVQIGNGNTFREGVTVHRSTEIETPTRIGSDCYLMVNSHVGHGTQLGDGVILTNHVLLAGHVQVGDRAVFGGAAAVHQFTRIGTFAMVAGLAPIRQDVIPYTMIGGEPVRHYRLNTVGLRRAGIKGERYRTLEKAYRALRSGAKELGELPRTPEIELLGNWLAAKSKRGIHGFLRPDDDA